MIGGVDVFGGSERTRVEVGFGGATGANDVVSARIAQVSRVLMFLLSMLLLLVAHSVADAVLGCFCLLLLQGKTTWFRAADCKAARKIDMGWPMTGLVVLWRPRVCKS